MNFSTFVFRATSLGSLMSDPDGKSNLEKWNDAQAALEREQDYYDAMKKKDGKGAIKRLENIRKWADKLEELDAIKYQEVLSTGAKTFLKRAYAKMKYNKRSATEFYDIKQLIKGTKSETLAINMLSTLDGRDYLKNTQKLNNGYISGTPDLFLGPSVSQSDYVIELKASWDIDSFYQNMETEIKQSYWWQLQAYMWLTGASIGELSYCLVTTPPHLLKDEQDRLYKKMGVKSRKDPRYLKAAEKMLQNLNYDDIPIQERRLPFQVERDEAAIARIPQKVEVARKYLQEIEEMHNKFSSKHVL